ncbi:MAG: carbohydrate kinase family protein [Candidatus Dormibacteraeota bacterium]|nr:carbohydrate kinase family protein [Candidatus Dormibacteraeota bacterium]
MGSIAVTGSVAYDTIMVFGGRFADHILADQTHILNVSFLIDRLDRRRGGTAANIAYTLALLGERPLLCAAVGNDFAEYGAELRAVGVDTSSALLCDDVTTATAFITTDLDDNQITAFFPGAMARAAGVNLEALSDVEHVIVGPDAPDGMALHVDQAGRIGARLVFAPAQQLSSLSDGTLTAGLDAAWLVVGNDYELELIHRRTGRDVHALVAGGAAVARTRGGQGSELHIDGTVERIPVAATEHVVDPTGAGDAFIAGLLAGLRAGRGPDVAGRMGALAATYVVETQGPQGHAYTRDEFATRYAEAFGEALS